LPCSWNQTSKNSQRIRSFSESEKQQQRSHVDWAPCPHWVRSLVSQRLHAIVYTFASESICNSLHGVGPPKRSLSITLLPPPPTALQLVAQDKFAAVHIHHMQSARVTTCLSLCWGGMAKAQLQPHHTASWLTHSRQKHTAARRMHGVLHFVLPRRMHGVLHFVITATSCSRL
jgi:hypothetical protein